MRKTVLKTTILLALVLALSSGCTIGMPEEFPTYTEKTQETTSYLPTAETSGGTARQTAAEDPVDPAYHNVLGNTRNDLLFIHSIHEYCIYESALYFPSARWGIGKYDLRTGLVSSACVDPGCLHNSASCPLYGVYVRYIDHIRDGVIHWTEQTGMYGGECKFYAYDIKNGEKKLIYSAPIGGSYSSIMWENDDVCFFKIGILKEDGDPTNSKDYEMAFIQMDKKTGKTDVAFYPFARSDSINTILNNGKIVLVHDRALYTVNPDGSDLHFVTEERGELYSIVGSCMYSLVTAGSVGPILEEGPVVYKTLEEQMAEIEEMKAQGLYVPPDAIPTEDEYIPKTTGGVYYNVVRTDLLTGERKVIVSEPVIYDTLLLTDDYLYYQPFDYHLTGGTRVYEGIEYPGHKSSSSQIVRVDLDGENRTVIREDFNYELINYKASILGDYLIAEVDTEVDETTGTYDDRLHKQFILYDLTNGETRELTFIEDIR